MSGSLPGQPAADARLMRRVRRRLVAWSAGSTLVLLLVLGSALYFSVDASLAASGLTQLDQQAAAVRGFVTRPQGPGPAGGEHRDPPIGRPEFGGPGSGTISIVVDPSGAFVGGEPADTTDLPVAAGVEAARAGAVDARLASVNGAPVRVRSEEVQVDGEPRIIQVIQDRTPEQRTLTTLLVVLVGGGLAALAVAAAFGFLYAGRALVPIRESLRRQREFTADASHELRTPLTIVRASVEQLRRHRDRPVAEVGDALGDIESEVGAPDRPRRRPPAVGPQRLGGDSAAARAGRPRRGGGEALQRLRGQADTRGVKLRLDAAPAQVSGDADRLRQVVAILIDNAIRHSPAGGTVMVAINGEGRPRVSVEDEGGGIKSDDLPHVFDRFWRAADAPSGGTGLGLAIAAWIAEHHGCAIIPSNRPSGGARFELQLPRG